MFKKKTLLVAFMIVSMILSNCSTVLAATVEAVNEVIEASKEEVTNETTVEEQNEVQNVEETINEVTEVLQPTEEVITENVITENVEVENVENAQEAPQEKELISVDENTNNDESVIVAKVPEIRAFSKEYVSKDGNTYEVNIVFGSNAKIPENAKISVKEFEKESKEFADAKEALVEQKAEELNLENLNMVALDISILDEKENEIEPDANV